MDATTGRSSKIEKSLQAKFSDPVEFFAALTTGKEGRAMVVLWVEILFRMSYLEDAGVKHTIIERTEMIQF